MKISVVIHTYNSEKFLKRVLESVKEFDEIVICDMHSTDDTLKIAEEYHCKIIFHEKCTHAEPARNFAIHSATHEWVLVVDSDEVIPEALRRYLYQRIQEADCPQGLWIPHKNYFMGKFMHGDYPGYILRFFKKEGSYWPPYVHTRVKVDGREEYLPARRKDLAFIHLINNPIELKLRKINTYTENEVEKRANQKIPYFKMFYAPFYRFIKAYIIKGGFRDGKAGLVNAGMDAFYKFVTLAKIWESRVKPEDIDPELKG
jgi:glycosyltransferase involved in cell wall biosynthesis